MKGCITRHNGMKLGNKANQISSLSSWKYVPNVHKCNSDCKKFSGKIATARSARYGLARRGGKKEGEAERHPCPSQHSAGSHSALCQPGVGRAVCHGGSLPKEPAGSPDPCKAELNRRAIARLHLALVKKNLG